MFCNLESEANFGCHTLNCQHCLLIKVNLNDIPEDSTTEGWLYSKNMSTYPAGEMEPWWDSISGSLVWDVLCTLWAQVVPDWERKSIWDDQQRGQLTYTPPCSPNSLLQGSPLLWCISTHYCCCYVGFSLYNKLNICRPGRCELLESS